MMRKTTNIQLIIFYACLLFVGADLVYSFLYYLNTPLDGDLAAIVLPWKGYQGVLEDPLGLKILLGGAPHAGPNRFFAHAFTYSYFNTVPYLLQYLTSPINSVYLASALIKLATHLGLLLLLARWILGPDLKWNLELALVLALLTPLFQSASHPGLRVFMNIIDAAASYFFAYAFSLFLLLIYLSPFFQMLMGRRRPHFSNWQGAIWIGLAVVNSLNGPLNAPVIMLAIPIMYLCFIQQQSAPSLFQQLKNIPIFISLQFTFILLMALYSFYLGTFNVENPVDSPSLAERYHLWWKGFRFLFIGLSSPSPLLILLLVSLVNSLIIWRNASFQSLKKVYAILLIFSLLYLILIPLGGYRSYRPEVLRYDVILPVTLCILFMVASSTYRVLFHLKGKQLYTFLVIPIAVILYFSIVDQHDLAANQCERHAFKSLQVAQQDTIELPYCQVMSWEPIKNPQQSEVVAKMLYRWNITSQITYFYHQKEEKSEKANTSPKSVD